MSTVTRESIIARLADVNYTRLAATTTVCAITLDNGFTVIGTSACVNPADFDAQKGKDLAYDAAFDKLWELEGYLAVERAWREDAMPETDVFGFGQAIEVLQEGYKVARQGWNGKGMWLELQKPDARSKMTLPYIYINYPANSANTPGARVR